MASTVLTAAADKDPAIGHLRIAGAEFNLPLLIWSLGKAGKTLREHRGFLFAAVELRTSRKCTIRG